MHKTNRKKRYFLDYIRQLRATERIGFAIALSLLVGLVTIDAYFQWQGVFRDKKSYISLIGQTQIGQFEAWHDSQMAEARELPASSVFINIVAKAIEQPSNQNLASIEEYLRPILRSYNYAESAVLTPDFHVLVSLTQLVESNGEEVRQEISQKKPRAPFFTTLHLTHPYGKPGFHIIVPLFEDGQKTPFAYVVQTFFASDYIYPMLAQWSGSEKTGETLLLERTGEMVQILNPPRLGDISAFLLQIPVSGKKTVEARAGLGQTGIMIGRDYRNKKVLAVANQVPGLGWTLLSKMDYAEAMSLWTPTLVITIMFILIALVTVSAHSYILFSNRALSTARSRLELLRRTERSEALLSAILEYVDAPVVIFDKSSAIQFSNRAFKEHFNDILPGGLLSLQSSPDKNDADAQPHKLELSDVKGKVLQLYVMPIHILLESQESLSGYVMRDVTELESALEQVQRLNQDLVQKVEVQTKRVLEAKEELRTMASAISHNLATPLRTIESFSELLATKAFDQLDAETSDYVMRIRRASANMAILTDDLMTFLSLDSTVLADEEFDFSIAAQEITSDIIRRNPRRRYQITIMPGLKMHGDRALLQTAFRNVMENAFQYCSDNTIASIDIGKYGKSGVFVKDNGIGMTPDEIDSILQPSSRAESENYIPGLSIRLTISKKIIELHEGSLEIESEQGKGTIVRFKF
jgi:signal transduction histidine kinase